MQLLSRHDAIELANDLRELTEERIPSIIYSVGPRELVLAHLPQWLCWDKRHEDASIRSVELAYETPCHSGRAGGQASVRARRWR